MASVNVNLNNTYDGGVHDTTNGIPVRFGNQGNLDAFARLRISSPETIFDNFSQYQNETLVWELATTGSATSTHNPNESSVDLNVTSANGDKLTRQTRQYFTYQPGKSHLVVMTFAFGAG